jgi:hypothetical protein
VKGLLILDPAVTYFNVGGTILYENFFSFSLEAKSMLQGREVFPEHSNFWWILIKKPTE